MHPIHDSAPCESQACNPSQHQLSIAKAHTKHQHQDPQHAQKCASLDLGPHIACDKNKHHDAMMTIEHHSVARDRLCNRPTTHKVLRPCSQCVQDAPCSNNLYSVTVSTQNGMPSFFHCVTAGTLGACGIPKYDIRDDELAEPPSDPGTHGGATRTASH